MNDQIKKTDKNIIQTENQDAVPSEKKASFFKRYWDRYLKRLNKITNGKAQCCK